MNFCKITKMSCKLGALFFLGVSFFIFFTVSEKAFANLVKDTPLVRLALQDKGKKEEEIPLCVEFAKNAIPAGSFYSVKVRAIKAPESHDMYVLVGVPKTKLRFDKVGDYTLEVATGYITRSS